MAMFRPTYQEIIQKVNEENGEETFRSRYSVVVAAARRARQLVDGDDPLVISRNDKPLTIAVNELVAGEVLVHNKEDE